MNDLEMHPQNRSTLSADQVFQRMACEFVPLLDVRSPSEFRRGSISGSHNLPILNDEQRHQVGLCYSQLGKAEAIELGLQLTAEDRAARTEQWMNVAATSAQPLLVTCWRGGLRSAYACQWLSEKGGDVAQVEGG